VPAVVLGGVVLLLGMRHLPREMALMQARLRAELGRVGSEQRSATDSKPNGSTEPLASPVSPSSPFEELHP
jgi:hypothetical protein